MGFHPTWHEILELIQKSERIFVKKLARNDTSWADASGNHQYGFFIPREIAEGDFFPELANTNPEKPHIFDVSYPTFWPASGEVRSSNIKYFSLRYPTDPERSKPRYEWQHTGVPKDQFRALSPASLLLSGKLRESISESRYWFIVVDSISEEAELVESYFDLNASFHYGLFDPKGAHSSATEALFDEISDAIKKGRLREFIEKHQLPSPDALAAGAQKQWIISAKRTDLDPYTLERPGDAVMEISRDIEYSLYKDAELRLRAAQVVETLLGEDGQLLRNAVHGFTTLNSIFLSASQSRKSRAGLSFEKHVERLFRDGRIRYDAQPILGGRRPDFALPHVQALNNSPDSMIVSLKTTLRERWKQLALEQPLGKIFLATVDDRVSLEAIKEMEDRDIGLVVPESLVAAPGKQSETVYGGRPNVVTFRQFFDDEIKSKRPSLLMALPPTSADE